MFADTRLMRILIIHRAATRIIQASPTSGAKPGFTLWPNLLLRLHPSSSLDCLSLKRFQHKIAPATISWYFLRRASSTACEQSYHLTVTWRLNKPGIKSLADSRTVPHSPASPLREIGQALGRLCMYTVTAIESEGGGQVSRATLMRLPKARQNANVCSTGEGGSVPSAPLS